MFIDNRPLPSTHGSKSVEAIASLASLSPTPLRCVLGLCVMVLAYVMVCTRVVCHGVGLCTSWCVLGLCVMVLTCWLAQ